MSNFKTNNQSYGSHYKQSASLNRQRMASSTLDFLKQTDHKSFIHEQQNIAQRARHGLFTQPMPLANGDNYKDKKPEKVDVNIKVSQRMQQKVGPELFQKMSSTNIDDMYKDKYKQQQLYLKEKNDLTVHPRAMIAGGKQKLVWNSQFEHKKEYNDKQYDTRDEQGNVKLGLRPFYNSKMKKGKGNTTAGLLFSSQNYIGTPYDNQRDQTRNDKLNHKAKIHQPFSGASKPGETFTPNYQTYHIEGEPYKPKNEQFLYRQKTNEKWKANNPNKKGYNGTFTEFPKYIEEGEKAKPISSHENVWKPNFNGTSKNFNQTLVRPCPPASQLLLNEIRRNK